VAVFRGCSSAIIPAWPRAAAQLSGVWPFLSGLLGLTSPGPSSIFTRSHPFPAANQSAVRPFLTRLSGLTSPRRSRTLTTPSRPLIAAKESGVVLHRPFPFCQRCRTRVASSPFLVPILDSPSGWCFNIDI